MQKVYEPFQAALEKTLLEELSPDAPWALIERFTTLVRESASEDEREAARYIVGKLEEFGVPHKVYNPDLFLSVPVESRLVVGGEKFAPRVRPFPRPLARKASPENWLLFRVCIHPVALTCLT